MSCGVWEICLVTGLGHMTYVAVERKEDEAGVVIKLGTPYIGFRFMGVESHMGIQREYDKRGPHRMNIRRSPYREKR